MAQILLIEDNAINMKLAVMLLEHAGHTVLTAENAEEGIRLAGEHIPELILMDIQLPGDMDGLDATRALRSDISTCDIKIVAMSACVLQRDFEAVEAAGCDGFVAKPIDIKGFLKTVEETLAEGRVALVKRRLSRKYPVTD